MNLSFGVFLFLCLSFFVSFCISQSNEDIYTAAVVEFIPVNYNTEVLKQMEEQVLLDAPFLGESKNEYYVSPSTVTAVKLLNLKRYEHFIMEAKSEGVDIIVFPEDTTTGWPIGYNNGRDGALPWLETIPSLGSAPYTVSDLQFSSPAVFLASKYAAQYNITVVIDIGEVSWCNENSGEDYSGECPDDGRWQFNTQLAFDESGTIIGKHRKLHLFLADTEIFNYPEESLDFFETSFGVKFGMMVCFDIWFSFPGFELSEQNNIENFVLSSWWENNGTLPLVSAVNMQQGFSKSVNGNLLACSVGLGFMNSGSGIYDGVNEEQNFNFDSEFLVKKDVLLIKELYKSPRSSSNQGNLKSKRIEIDSLSSVLSTKENTNNFITSTKPTTLISLPYYSSSNPIQPVAGNSLYFSLENNDLECTFNISISDNYMGNSTLIAMAYRGPYFDDLLQADVCAIYRCSDYDFFGRGNCATLTLESDVSFDYISITGNFESSQNIFTMASQNNGQLLPMESILRVPNYSLNSIQMEIYNQILVNVVMYAPSVTQNYY